MSNLSKKKRQEIHEFLSSLKKDYSDDVAIQSINEIERLINEKKYGLVWEKHTEKVDEMLKENIPIFKEVEDKKIVNVHEGKFNFLLEGDNLHSLKLLEKTHKEKIDLAYLDPPYNTGNKDFEYNDEYVDKEDGYKHSKWLSFMSERLKIANKLLVDGGFLFISIDDNELANLRLLCDSIFGEQSFVNCIAVKMSEATGVKMTHAEKRLPKLKEYVLFYKKNPSSQISINETKIPKEGWDEEYKILVEGVSKEELKFIKELMNKERVSKEELSKGDKISSKMKFTNIQAILKKNMKEKERIEILHNNSYRILRDVATSGGAKRIADNKKKTLGKSNGAFLIRTPRDKIYLIRSDYNHKSKQPRMKMLFADQYLDVNVGDFWYDIKTTGLGAEGGVNFTNGKKPIKLIQRLLNLYPKKEITILDFFAGSGTTGEAVLKLNKKDGGNRKYILCTNNENNICEEVTYQRLENIQSELPHNLKYFKTDFIPKFSEEEVISTKLIPRIKEMIELENMCEIDGKRNLLILNEEDLENKINEDIVECANIYIPSHILLSREEENIIEKKNINIIDIPDYYFMEELREVGEL